MELCQVDQLRVYQRIWEGDRDGYPHRRTAPLPSLNRFLSSNQPTLLLCFFAYLGERYARPQKTFLHGKDLLV